MPQTIMERIIDIRGNLSQADFSRTLGINVNTLRAYEKGRAQPNLFTLTAICEKFSVSPEWILTGNGSARVQNAAAHTELREESPHNAPKAGTDCGRCDSLLDMLREEWQERRELSRENRMLWKENAFMREENARLMAETGCGEAHTEASIPREHLV